MQYVYRYYIDGRGNINQRWLYVGITKDLHSRIYQHKRDKLAGLEKTCSIQYFAVNSRFDAEALETYLIGLYQPIYNDSKKDFDKDNEPTFLGDAVNEIEWCNYFGKDFPLCDEPFVMQSRDYIFGQARIRRVGEVFSEALRRTATA